MMGKLMLAVALAFITLFLAGCASNNYVPCCQKQNIYDLAGADPAALLSNPYCNFTNGSVIYSVCDRLSTGKGMANCSNGASCASITDQDECRKTSSCAWNPASSPKCTGEMAYWMLPVCADPAPASCVNEKCSAMVCGYSKLQLGPTPTSSDFNADTKNPPFSTVGDPLTGTGLFGTSCAFKTMNNKLYNQVRQSKGRLWVNSFRFGVGRSYSDYEQARYYFPVSDRFCSPTGAGTRDRFINYVGYASTWCSAYTANHYHCSKNNLNFSTADACRNYCFGLSAPQDCNPTPTTNPPQKYNCLYSGFLYDVQDSCKRDCQMLSDPGACSSDPSKYPFLEPDARFKSVLQADYIYGTNTVYADSSQSYKDACKQSNWRGEHYWCDDFYPFECGNNSASECLWSNSPGGHRQGMQWKLSRDFSLEMDYGYYKNVLQTQITNQTAKGPYECTSSMDCISGACDMNDYRRYLCKDTAGGLIDCGCGMEGSRSISCGYFGSGKASATGNATLYVAESYDSGERNFGFRGPMSSVLFDAAHFPKIADGSVYVFAQPYSSTRPALPSDTFDVLKNCAIPPVRTSRFFPAIYLNGKAQNINEFVQVDMCLMPETKYNYYYGRDETGRYFLVPTNYSNMTVNNVECDLKYSDYDNITHVKGRRVYASAYQFNFTLKGTDGVVGQCKLNAVPKSAVEPYIELQTFGWCLPCTYATLAVQKVDVVDRTWSYNCYDFRAQYNYSAADGNATTMSSEGKSTRENAYSVSAVKRNNVISGTEDPTQNGPIDRSSFSSPLIGSDTAQYSCEDGWGGTRDFFGGWSNGWHVGALTSPSLPYVVKKTRDYLSAGVMPILDVTGGGPQLWAIYENRFWWNGMMPNLKTLRVYTQGKKLQDVDGAVIYAIATLGQIRNNTLSGEIGTGDGTYDQLLADYLGMPKTTSATNIIGLKGGANLTLYTAAFLKKGSANPPLVAIDVGNPDGSEAVTYSTLDDFFYKPKQTGREWRIANAVPDKYPGNIDLLLQEWAPTCTHGGATADEKIEKEFEYRMNISRNFLKNYSRPSLIWKFHFPKSAGSCNVENFTSYLFDHQGEMVDAGVIGLIYDAWMTDNGATYIDYSNPQWDGGAKSGTTDGLTGYLYNDLTLEQPGASSKTSTFCIVQNQSKKVMGISKRTFGQKVYAKNASCLCEPCDRSDLNTGFCTLHTGGYQAGDENLDQLYCMDGTKCEMPPDFSAGRWTNYSYYRCPALCANTSACTNCDKMPAPATGSNLFCRIETGDGGVMHATKNYKDLSDDYWDIISALQNKDKCCLNTTDARTNAAIKYTYIKKEGVKQRNEFLQYPRRGDLGIDCGRTPNTDFLVYCNIKVPITNNQLFCSRVS